jgi:hypothetical protein
MQSNSLLGVSTLDAETSTADPASLQVAAKAQLRRLLLRLLILVLLLQTLQPTREGGYCQLHLLPPLRPPHLYQKRCN